MSQLLTARGGKYELPEHVQAMMALTSDGKLFVSKSHEKNLLVLDFVSHLKRRNEAFSQHLVDFSQIQAMYQEGAEGVTGDTYYQRWVVSMIKEAVSKGASDIHIEVKPTHTQVECRVTDFKGFGGTPIATKISLHFVAFDCEKCSFLTILGTQPNLRAVSYV